MNTNQNTYIPRTTFANGRSPWQTHKPVKAEPVPKAKRKHVATKRERGETICLWGESTIMLYEYVLHNPGQCCAEIVGATGLREPTVAMQLWHWARNRHIIRDKRTSYLTGRKCWHYTVNDSKPLAVNGKELEALKAELEALSNQDFDDAYICGSTE
jgi:hypothetical protein